MTESERDKKVYELAKEYLVGLNIERVTSSLIDKYLGLTDTKPRPDSIAEIYMSILESAQDANMKAAVIGKSIGGVDKLGVVLCNFKPCDILQKFTEGWEQILDDIELQLKPSSKTGRVRREPRSIWPHYCQTILSAARFMAQFNSADEFYEWVSFFDSDDRVRPALPMLLEKEIEGFGFALSCHFLKELGFVKFAKPDVHLHDIFKGLQLCSPKADDYAVFKAVVRVAKHANVSPYAADKLFWLIGSGDFYADPDLKIGSQKQAFIKYAQSRLCD